MGFRLNLFDKPEGMEAWMTAGELAIYLNRGRSTIERWFAKGKIPPPAYRTNLDWKLWSPEQVSEILAMASKKQVRVRKKSSKLPAK